MADNYDYGFGYDWGYDTPYLDQEADLPLAYDPSGNASWDFQFTDLGKLLKSLGGDVSSGSALKAIGSILGGGGVGAALGSAGITALLNRLSGGNKPAPVGYQGGIPEYTVERTQMPYQTGQQNEMLRLKQAAQDAMSTGATQDQVRNAAFRTYGISPSQFDQAMQTQGTYRRPGQGGITYFAPTKYTPTGKDLAAPVVAAPAAPATPTTGGMTDSTTNTTTPQYATDSDRQVAIGAAHGGAMPGGGIAMLAKGRYIKGNGDGVSDSVPAKFVGSGRPAALSDGEFVFPARIVAELGNGSNEAGAKKLYAFMDRVEARAKSAKRGKPSGADKELSRLA